MRHTNCEGRTRRDALKLGSAGLLGLGLADFLRLEAKAKEAGRLKSGKAKSVIVVWLPGGPATIDMWDLKPNAPETIRGDFKPIKTKTPGLEISEHLPKCAAASDKFTVVRSLAHTIPAHEIATVFMNTGNKPTAALQYPALGSLASKLLPVEKGVPAFVTFGDLRGGKAGSAGYLGTGHNPFLVEGGGGGKGAGAFNLRVRGVTLPKEFGVDELAHRDALLGSFDASFKALDEASDLVDGLDSFHHQALDILRSDKTKKAFDLTREPQALRERYGLQGPGQAALAARRLVEAGVRFATLSVGGWDTHKDNFKNLKDTKLPQLDTVLSALITDLADRGMLDSTLVYCVGEFGRTPKVNKDAGRDHWARSMACVLAGGGLKRGYVHGSTDEHGMAPASDAVTPDDVAATLFHCLGLDPHAELQTPTGRPVQLFREGKVVEKLLA